MTSSLFRGRPRRARSRIPARLAHAVLGSAAGIVMLVLPGMTTSTDSPVAITRPAHTAPAAQEDGTSTSDLFLPFAVVGAAGALAVHGYIRRVRRTRDRTTPAGTATDRHPVPPPLTDLDDRARTALVDADNCIRASREELACAEARSAPEALAPFIRAVQDAEGELSAAFRIRRRYDEGFPEEEAARLHALAGIVGRCQEAGRRLDLEAPAFRRLRALDQDLAPSLETAETRFRTLAGRTAAAETSLTDLATRYAPTATTPATGYTEQAKDRLVFATLHLNQARQSDDLGEPDQAARHLRAAESATAQAAVFIEAVDGLAARLQEAVQMLPAALTGAEAELAAFRTSAPPVGETYAQLMHADAVLASVRQELTNGQPHDPLTALRRIVRATAPLATGRTGVLPAAALLTARASLAAADDFITTHRAAVGATARTRLAESRRLLTTNAPSDRIQADTLALESRELAERDVRLHGNPYPEAAGHESGTAGAVLGGVLTTGSPDDIPSGFGGPRTRRHRGLSSG